MSDLANLTADQLAENVRRYTNGERDDEAYAALAELQTRANLLREVTAQCDDLSREVEAAEKERDEAWNTCSTCGEMSGRGNGCEECTEFRSEAGYMADEQAAEARLAETLAWGKQIHDALDGRPLPEHPDEAPARIAALKARLAETQKALEGKDATIEYLRQQVAERDRLSALTTHPEGKP